MSINTLIPKVKEKHKVSRVLSQEEIEGKTVEDLMYEAEEGDYLVLLNGYDSGDSTMVSNLNRISQYAGAVIVSHGFPAQIQMIQKTKENPWSNTEYIRIANDFNNGVKVYDEQTYCDAGYEDLEVAFYKDERIEVYENCLDLHHDEYAGWDLDELEKYIDDRLENDGEINKKMEIIKDLQKELDEKREQFDYLVREIKTHSNLGHLKDQINVERT